MKNSAAVQEAIDRLALSLSYAEDRHLAAVKRGDIAKVAYWLDRVHAVDEKILKLEASL